MSDAGRPLQLLHGPDIKETLGRGDVDVFEYTVNRPGLYLILVVAGIFYALAAYTWWDTGLASTLWVGIFAALVVGGAALSLWVMYWHNFASTHLLAASTRQLYVGAKDRLWCIDWDLLDAATMGFEDMELSRMKGALSIRVGGQEIDVHLFNGFVLLEDMQGFMFRVLSELSEDDEEGRSDRKKSPTP